MATTNGTDKEGDRPPDWTSNLISHSNGRKLHLEVQPDRSSSPRHCARRRRPLASGLRPAPSTSRYFISVSVSLSLHLSLSLDFMSNIYPVLVFLALCLYPMLVFFFIIIIFFLEYLVLVLVLV